MSDTLTWSGQVNPEFLSLPGHFKDRLSEIYEIENFTSGCTITDWPLVLGFDNNPLILALEEKITNAYPSITGISGESIFRTLSNLKIDYTDPTTPQFLNLRYLACLQASIIEGSATDYLNNLGYFLGNKSGEYKIYGKDIFHDTDTPDMRRALLLAEQNSRLINLIKNISESGLVDGLASLIIPLRDLKQAQTSSQINLMDAALQFTDNSTYNNLPPLPKGQALVMAKWVDSVIILDSELSAARARVAHHLNSPLEYSTLLQKRWDCPN